MATIQTVRAAESLGFVGTGMSALGTLAPGGAITIVSNSDANPTVVTTLLPHGLASLDSVVFAGTNSTPVIDGLRLVTRINATTFSVPVDCTGGAGTAGTYVPSMTANIGNPVTITAGTDHGLRVGDTVTIAGTDSTPVLDGVKTVIAVTDSTFQVDVETTAIASVGDFSKTTYYSDVLDRGNAIAGGALVITSTVGTAPKTATVNIQGSADGTNWFNIPYALVATPRTFVLTALTITTAVATTYLLQELVYWRYLRLAISSCTNVALVPTIHVVE